MKTAAKNLPCLLFLRNKIEYFVPPATLTPPTTPTSATTVPLITTTTAPPAVSCEPTVSHLTSLPLPLLSSPLVSLPPPLSFAPSSLVVAVGEKKNVDCLRRRSRRSNLGFVG